MLNKCTSPFLLVFFPPIKIISLGEIERALQAHSGFYNALIDLMITYLHSDSEYLPKILFNFIDLNAIVYLLLCTAKETTESIDEFIVD
jgi:hypothetical protein